MRASVFRSMLLAAPITLLLASTALAATPGRQVVPVYENFVEDPGGFFNPCNQALNVVVSGNLYLTGYFDQSGNLIRLLITEPHFTATITGPNGISLSGFGPTPEHINVSNNTFVLTGVVWRFILPGTGSVFAIAGRETFNLDTGNGTFSGESTDWNAAAVCSYLGAN